MESLFLHHLETLGWLMYVVIFLLLLVEGEGTLFIAAFLAHQGFLKPTILIPVVVTSVVLGDILWFRFGSYLETSFPFIRRYASRVAGPIDKNIVNRPFHTIFIAKFAYGLYRATLLRAGALMPLKTFLKIDIIVALIWITIIGGIGYGSSASLMLIKHYLKYAEAGILLAVVALLILMRLVSKFSKKEIEI